jgi:hypothetical protein
MTPIEIAQSLESLFGQAVQKVDDRSWQVETQQTRLLILLSEDQSWIRILLPIAPLKDAKSFLEQLLEANFDETQETRYALHQNVVWGVFHHSRETLTLADFEAAIARLLVLNQQGLSNSFNAFAEMQVRQIVTAAKQQGQSLEATLKTLERFYTEGVMGSLSQDAADRQAVLDAWRYQLERLWPEVD